MTKSDLKSGMSVLNRDGEKALIVLHKDSLLFQFENSCWDELKSFNEDLTSVSSYKGLDIVSVFEGHKSSITREKLCNPKIFYGKDALSKPLK